MKKTLRMIGLCAVGLGVVVYSCVHRELIPMPEIPNKGFTVQEAKNYYDKHITSIKRLDLSAGVTKSGSDQRTLTPDWSRTTQATTARSVVLNIPFVADSDTLAYLLHKQGGKTEIEAVHSQTTLVMEKYLESEKIRTFVTTNLGMDPTPKRGKESPYLYTGSRRSFTGYMVISDEEGHFRFSYSYENGKRTRVSLRSGKSHPELMEQEEYRGFLLSENSLLRTKGGPDTCWICLVPLNGGICPLCGNSNIDPAIVTDDYYICENCGGAVNAPEYYDGDVCTCTWYYWYCPYCLDPYCWGECILCPYCGEPFCMGECLCPFCYQPFCNGECQSGNSGGGGSNPPPADSVTVVIDAGVGGTVDPIGEYRYPKNVQMNITATPDPGYMFTSWSGDASSTVQSINPVLDGDKWFNASFSLYPNSNSSSLDSAFIDALSVLPSMLQNQIDQLFADGSFYTYTMNSGIMQIMQDGDGYGLGYNPSIMSSDKMNGMMMSCLHELWHLNQYLNSGSNDHETMVDDTTYQGWINSLFPGVQSDMRSLLKFYGASDTEGYDNLSQNEKDDFDLFLENNGFKFN